MQKKNQILKKILYMLFLFFFAVYTAKLQVLENGKSKNVTYFVAIVPVLVNWLMKS